MQEKLKEMLASMLKDLDGGKTVEEIVETKMKEAGLSEESMAAVMKSMEYVDRLDAAHESLKKAKAQGASREEWLNEKVEAMREELPEEQREIADTVLETVVERSLEITNEWEGKGND